MHKTVKFGRYGNSSIPMFAARVYTPISACFGMERAFKWCNYLQVSVLYSLFAWLTLDALIAPHWLFLVFWKIGRTPREREHMGESCRHTCCKAQCTTQAQAKSTVPLAHLQSAHQLSGIKVQIVGAEAQGKKQPCFHFLCHFPFADDAHPWCESRTSHTNNTTRMWACLCICLSASIKGQGSFQTGCNTWNNINTIWATWPNCKWLFCVCFTDKTAERHINADTPSLPRQEAQRLATESLCNVPRRTMKKGIVLNSVHKYNTIMELYFWTNSPSLQRPQEPSYSWNPGYI